MIVPCRTIPGRRAVRRDSLRVRATLARVAAAGVALASIAAAAPAFAQAFPAKPIRMIVPYPPGGGTDIVARALAAKLAETGITLVVDNRPGASEMIGTEAAARSAPDGYTIGLVTNSFSINPALGAKVPYESRDFAPLTLLATSPFMLAVNPSVSAKTVAEVIALAKARPGGLNYASLGTGTPHHLSMEWFKHLAGVDIVPVPYKGLAPGLTATMTGEVQMIFTGLTAGLSQVRAGKLRGIAVTTAKRAAAAPEFPTMAEAGLTGFDVYAWYGLLVPTGTPAPVIARLNAEFTKALGAPDVQERFRNAGVENAATTPEAFGQFLREDAAMWSRIVKQVGAKAE
jgi:tripartite-type tricarboxylate transporter receptor subunit TctC